MNMWVSCINSTYVYYPIHNLLAQLVSRVQHTIYTKPFCTDCTSAVCASFVLLDVRDNIRYLCCLSMHRQQAVWPHSWSSVRATQHAALSSLLWAGPSTPPPVVMLRLRLVSFFSSLAKEIPFFLSSRTFWKQRPYQVRKYINRQNCPCSF